MFGLVRPVTSLARTGQGDTSGQGSQREMSRVRQEMDDFVTRAFGFTPWIG